MPVSIYSPNKHFLSAYSVPGNVVGTGDKEISKTYSSFLGPQLTLIEKAWVGLNAIRQGTTNLLARKPFTRPRQSVLPTIHRTLPTSLTKISTGNI